MIGQTNLLSKIDKIINSYPKFSIIVGPKNSGKKQVCSYICNKLGLQIVKFGTSIDDVRNVILSSYEQVKPICYLCADADGMSIGAKNSLLKITEEPPQNAYFILTLTSLENTLETLKSRGTVLQLDNYTENDIIQYREYRKYPKDNDDLVRKICTTTGEVDELFGCNISEFYTYVKNIFDYIHLVNTGNIFKISNKLKLKETGGKELFSPFLVFKLLRSMYIQEGLRTKDERFLMASNVTTKCLLDLNLPTVSKQGTIDNWVLEVRKVLNA